MSYEQYPVRPFKYENRSFWCSYYHFIIIDGKLICAAGGIPPQEAWDSMKKYLDKNNIKYTI